MKLFITAALLFCAANLFAQDAPHWLTESDKNLYRNGYSHPGFGANYSDLPTGPVRTMAEWEELEGIVIKWMSFTPILTEIVRYASQEGLVFVLCPDSNTVKTALTNAGIPLNNIRYIRASTTGSQNSIWSRDYGPWAIYRHGPADSLGLVDWIYNRPRPGDDTNSVTISQFINTPLFRTLTAPNDLVNTGGNFMVDGHGTGFASKLILTENQAGNQYGVSAKTEAQIDAIMNSYMGINRYIKMTVLPYDGIHHIDMHMKLLDEETLLVGQYPPGVADGPQIEANLQYVLNNFQTCFGKPYKVVRIPMPPSSGGQYPPVSSYYTYTNSTFVNKTVLVPIYGFPQDTTALRIYRENLPGYRVIGINCNAIIGSSGAIHCINKEIGVKEPVWISHSALRNTTNTTTPYQVKAYIKTKSGVNNAKLYWTTDTTAGYTQVNMTMAADTFSASIPARPIGTKIYYYISAASNSGKTITKPLTAPSGNIRFQVTTPTSITGETEIVKQFALHQNYPNPFNPSTTIKYAIPSASIVKLTVYDASGRIAAVLVNETKQQGVYEAVFNAAALSSGIYFYKLEAGNFTDIKKLILVK